MTKKSRVTAHKIETQALDFIQASIDQTTPNGDALFRGITGRDYGIDGIVELFENGVLTGNIAFIQIKGTADTIQKLKRKACVSCSISSSNAMYAIQNTIPVILCYTSLKDHNGFYYLCLNEIINESYLTKIHNQKTITVNIPTNNYIQVNNMTPLFNKIKSYFE